MFPLVPWKIFVKQFGKYYKAGKNYCNFPYQEPLNAARDHNSALED
jgi:hypothetical protein